MYKVTLGPCFNFVFAKIIEYSSVIRLVLAVPTLYYRKLRFKNNEEKQIVKGNIGISLSRLIK